MGAANYRQTSYPLEVKRVYIRTIGSASNAVCVLSTYRPISDLRSRTERAFTLEKALRDRPNEYQLVSARVITARRIGEQSRASPDPPPGANLDVFVEPVTESEEYLPMGDYSADTSGHIAGSEPDHLPDSEVGRDINVVWLSQAVSLVSSYLGKQILHI